MAKLRQLTITLLFVIASTAFLTYVFTHKMECAVAAVFTMLAGIVLSLDDLGSRIDRMMMK